MPVQEAFSERERTVSVLGTLHMEMNLLLFLPTSPQLQKSE